MKNLLSLITITIALLSCSDKAGQQHDLKTGDTAIKTKEHQLQTSNLFTLSDAEKILGEQAHLTDSSPTIKEGTLTYLCSYTANSKDQETGKTGVIYFLLEQYNEVTAAQKKYSSIKTANQDHGIKVLEGIGDEAYFHSDMENFYFIMVRKGSKVFNMKVNKITGNTSLDEFHQVAKKITIGL